MILGTASSGYSVRIAVPDAVIPDIVGHADITTSKDLYSHQLLDEPQERLDALKDAVGRLVGFIADDRQVRA